MNRKIFTTLALLVFATFGSSLVWTSNKGIDKNMEKGIGKKAAQTALDFYNKQTQTLVIKGKSLRIASDCSNFVRAVFWQASNGKLDLFEAARSSGAVSGSANGTTLISKFFEKNYRFGKKKFQVGDVVVFDNTYDKNKNQKRDDPYTHIAVVVKIDSDGTITFVHGNYGGKIKKGFINTQYKEYKKGNKLINTFLRKRYEWEKNLPSSANTAATLLRGFGGF